jgi:methyl-accepting chemotaxis protein
MGADLEQVEYGLEFLPNASSSSKLQKNCKVFHAMTTGSTRIEQLESLAQTILLAIDQLRQRQEASHQAFQQELQASCTEFNQRISANAEQIAANFEQIAANAEQIRAATERSNINAEQIAANTAGLVELRSILADYLRSRTDTERG